MPLNRPKIINFMSAMQVGNKPVTAAAIDIGSNTFRLLIAEVKEGRMQTVVKKLASVRLGQDLAVNGNLAENAMARALTVLQSFKKILDEHQPQISRVCGTAALRGAGNREEFLATAEKILGAGIEVISGREEALLSLKGALSSLQQSVSGPLLLVAVGGGSTECIKTIGNAGSRVVDQEDQPQIVSLALGAVGLTEEFLHKPTPAPEELETMSKKIKEQLSSALNAFSNDESLLLRVIGTGGTATSMAALDQGLEHYDETRIQGYSLSQNAMDRLWKQLVILSADERNSLPGLEKGRGEIILAGIKVYQILLELLPVEQMIVSDAGLLEGILLSPIDCGRSLPA